MDREKSFEEFIQKCKEHGEFCGQGEKNSDILIVGKESTNESIESNYNLCKEEWGCGVIRDDTGIKTWSNYQSLIDYIYDGIKPHKPEGKLDFEKYAYTTELSSVPRKQSNYSNAKSSIQDRLRFFKESKFIQDFPVIILACGGYIKNDDKVREIDNTFHVEFCREYGSKESKNRFWTHVDDKNAPTKLVIHTRQLSNGVSKDLIKEMSKVIRVYLRKLGK
jgi:hypothetical protein